MLYDWSTVVIVFFFLIRMGIKSMPQCMREVVEAIRIWNNRSQPAPAAAVMSIPASGTQVVAA